MNKLEIVCPHTGEVKEYDGDDLHALNILYEDAKAQKDEAAAFMEKIKMLLIQKANKSAADPNSLTRRIEGQGVVAILRESPKVKWDEIKLQKVKRILSKKDFERFFKTVTEYKPIYRELNKLPHTVAKDKNEQKAYQMILSARVPSGESYFSLSWEKKKNV